MEFKKYRRSNIAEMHKIVSMKEANDVINYLSKIGINLSISDEDINNGSPKVGDFIARNPNNYNDVWLVAKKYAEENFEEI